MGGLHFGQDGFVYTGTGAADRALNVPYFSHNFFLVAPSGACLDVSADDTTEFFAELLSCVNSDSLGTINGYKVPSLVKCAFDTFNTDLTFSGTSKKLFMTASPFRGAADNAKAVTLAPDMVTDIIDFTGNYFKSFGTGAVALSQDAAATINTFAILRGNAFDSSQHPWRASGPSPWSGTSMEIPGCGTLGWWVRSR